MLKHGSTYYTHKGMRKALKEYVSKNKRDVGRNIRKAMFVASCPKANRFVRINEDGSYALSPKTKDLRFLCKSAKKKSIVSALKNKRIKHWDNQKFGINGYIHRAVKAKREARRRRRESKRGTRSAIKRIKLNTATAQAENQ